MLMSEKEKQPSSLQKSNFIEGFQNSENVKNEKHICVFSCLFSLLQVPVDIEAARQKYPFSQK